METVTSNGVGTTRKGSRSEDSTREDLRKGKGGGGTNTLQA